MVNGIYVLIPRHKKDDFINLNVFFSDMSVYQGFFYIARMSKKNFDIINTPDNSHIFENVVRVRNNKKEPVQINCKY